MFLESKNGGKDSILSLVVQAVSNSTATFELSEHWKLLTNKKHIPLAGDPEQQQQQRCFCSRSVYSPKKIAQRSPHKWMGQRWLMCGEVHYCILCMGKVFQQLIGNYCLRRGLVCPVRSRPWGPYSRLYLCLVNVSAQ